MRVLLAWCLLMLSFSGVAAPGDIIFSDDFESGSLSPNWSTSDAFAAGINDDTSNSGSESLFLRWRAVSVRTLALDLNVPEAELSFWWRRGSNSFNNRPEGSEDLFVEYLTAANTWVQLDQFSGGGQQGQSATETYTLPADALFLGGAIRFRFAGGDGPDFDYWHVDDVVITETGTPISAYCSEAGVIFCDEFERALLGTDWSVSGSGNVLITGATSNSGTASMSTFGGRPESTLRTLDLSSYASVTLDFWWARGDDDWTPSEDPDNNEDLVVEYRTGFGSWVELDRLTGNGQPGFSESLQFTLPADALAANFQLRFRQTNGNSGAFDYFHIDDVRLIAGQALQCFFDDFNRGNLGADWVTSAVSGGFAPRIVNSRLRLTQDTNNQSVAASLQRLFPADNNIVTIEYDHYAWSTQGGSGADGIAVVFSDAAVTPQAGGFGGSLGYAQLTGTNAGFAGGWVGIGIDEYGNFANPTEGRQGGIGRTADSVTLRGSGSGQSGYRFIDNSGGLNPGIDQRNAPANVGGPNHRYRFVIDARTAGQTWVTVQRNTGTGFNNIIGPVDVETQAGQAAIPQNLLLSFTGSTGGSRNVHEIDNLEVCASDLEPIGTLVHHFEFYYSGNGLTCTPKDKILIRACANADCSTLFTDPVEVTLSPSGWGRGNPLTFSDTFTITNGEAEVSLAVTTVTTVDLEVTSSDPTTQAFTQNLCSINGGALSTDCSLSFLDTGLLVSVPNMTANVPVTATIAAVETATDTKECTPAFGNVDKTVAFWSGYVNPNSGTLPIQLEDGSVFSDISDSETAPTNVTLRFDSTGEAQISLNYQDAGLMNLSARYTGSGDDAGLVMNGSDQFVSVPAGFCITTGDSCPAADSSCPKLRAAGENFPITITPVASDGNMDYCSGNSVTENFASSMTLSHSLIAPSGGAPGTLSPVDYSHSSDGALTLNNVRISEVGVFQLDTAIDGGSYLGVDVSPGSSFEPGVTSLPFGRQIPYRFEATVTPGELAPTCGNFSYIGESLSWLTPPRISLDALNAQGDTTVNYSFSGFNRLGVDNFEPEAIGSDNSNLGTDGNTLAVSETFNAGTLSDIGSLPSGRLEYVFSNTDALSYNKSLLARVAPFNPDLTITLDDFQDDDGVGHTSPVSDLIFNPQANFDMRYGRLWLEDTYGPETQDLAMPMRTEFFSAAGRFEQNTDDSCTVFASTSAALAPAGFTSLQNSAGTLAAGRDARAFVLDASAPNQGSVDVTYDAATVLPWLQDDYDGDGSLDNPTGTATFGIYRGHDRVIYWRELP